MNKFLKLFYIAIIPITLTIISCFYSDLKGVDLILSSVIIVICCIGTYVANINEKMEEKEKELNEKLSDRDSEIQSLNDRMSQMAIYSNGNTPYVVQMYLKNNSTQGVRRNQFNNIEFIISTINKNYDIKYLNISFDIQTKVDIEQDKLVIVDNAYSIINRFPNRRNNKKEYNFKIKDEFVDKLTAKCLLKLKFEDIGKQNIIIEVVGTNNLIRRVEQIEFNVID